MSRKGGFLPPRTQETSGTRLNVSRSAREVYEWGAREFLGRLQKEITFMAGGVQNLAKLTPAREAQIREALIRDGKYMELLVDVSKVVQFKLGGASASARAGKFLLDPKVAARIMQLSERISTINAMGGAKFGASWKRTTKLLKTIMKTGPNADRYAKQFLTEASMDKHIAKAFREAPGAREFIKKVLVFDEVVAFERGHKSTATGGVGGNLKFHYKEAFGFKIMGDYSPGMMRLIDPNSMRKGVTKYRPQTIPLWVGVEAPMWENCISLKALPDSMMKKLGISAEGGAKLAFGRISASVEGGAAEGLLASVAGAAEKRPIPPFAGSLMRTEVAGKSTTPPKFVPKDVMERVAAEAARPPKLVKGAAAVALFMIGTALAASLMEKKKAGKQGLGGTVPERTR